MPPVYLNAARVDSADEFEALLAVFAKHPIDLLTVHGRTVKHMYRPGVRYDLIAPAARELRCPVLANGNVHSAAQARDGVRHWRADLLLAAARSAIRGCSTRFVRSFAAKK